MPSTHMRCMITDNRRAKATIAFFSPRCLAIFIAQALSHGVGPLVPQAEAMAGPALGLELSRCNSRRSAMRPRHLREASESKIPDQPAERLDLCRSRILHKLAPAVLRRPLTPLTSYSRRI